MTKRRKSIVVIGGGTGIFVVLSALKNCALDLKAIVSMADDGGSTGELRDQYGVLPPGDVRRALIALSDSSDILRKLFNYRFKSGRLGGHNFGNIFLTALEKITGDFGQAVDEAGRILKISGEVIPVTLDNVRLHARLADGKIIRGETNIDIPLDKARASIRKVWLKPRGRLNPRARRAIARADLMVIGPGDIYTSIIPNFLVTGIAAAIRKSKAKKAYIVNLMTKPGETDYFKAGDFVREIEKYLGREILDFVIFNNRRPAAAVLKQYAKTGAVMVDPTTIEARKSRYPKIVLSDVLDRGRFIRHSPGKKLARLILSLLD